MLYFEIILIYLEGVLDEGVELLDIYISDKTTDTSLCSNNYICSSYRVYFVNSLTFFITCIPQLDSGG